MNPQYEVLNSSSSSSQAQRYPGADMIEVKDAVKVAKAAANDFLGQEMALNDLMLEEVELDPNSNTWAITLGFNVPNPNRLQRIGAALSGEIFSRKYKTFIIDAQTGEFRSMKIREI
ncbi:hypothetical protein SB759_09025 [Pseudomonas sp. SIMBA_059]|nr:hypothetical protein [Pseudomonas palleroniana]